MKRLLIIGLLAIATISMSAQSEGISLSIRRVYDPDFITGIGVEVSFYLPAGEYLLQYQTEWGSPQWTNVEDQPFIDVPVGPILVQRYYSANEPQRYFRIVKIN